MKITLDVDCTPEEARTFMGLPDVKPMQDRLLEQLQERLTVDLGAMKPEALMKMWLPTTMKGFEQIQELFRSQLGGRKEG